MGSSSGLRFVVHFQVLKMANHHEKISLSLFKIHLWFLDFYGGFVDNKHLFLLMQVALHHSSYTLLQYGAVPLVPGHKQPFLMTPCIVVLLCRWQYHRGN